MKKIISILSAAAVMFSMVSCEGIFDSLEGDLTKMTAEDLMKSETGVQGLLANIYNYIPMNTFNTSDRGTLLASGRIGGEASYYSSGNSWWNYTNMRVINKFIEDLDDVKEKKIINEQAYSTYKGEAMFIRAYCYFAGAQNCGGMPIVDRTLDNELDGGENLGLFIKRRTEYETYKWICAQLEDAANLLPETINGGPLRANKYVAYALESRVALWAASVAKYQHRAGRELNQNYTSVKEQLTNLVKPDGSDCSAEFYQICIDASKKVIDSGKYKLYGENPASPAAATTNLIDLFQSIKYEEYIFGKTWKTGINSADNGCEGWGPYQVASANYMEGNGAVTANMVDWFANYGPDNSTLNGTVQTKSAANAEDYYLNDCYDKPEDLEKILSELKRYDSIDGPFKNKDARFQAWVVYPGSVFRGETMAMQAGLITADGKAIVMPEITANVAYKLNGQDYYPYGKTGSKTDFSAFYNIRETYNDTNAYEYCFGTKKFLDQTQRVVYTQSPWYDIRYAEILLNYAEAVAESGLGDKTLAANCLNDVHARAGFKRDLDLNVNNVINEVRVEFMAENHWQGVLMRRREYISDVDGVDNSRELGGGFKQAQKITFLPMQDLSTGTVKYIFPRALPYYSSFTKTNKTPRFDVKPDSYYGQVSNYVNNRITPNKQLQ